MNIYLDIDGILLTKYGTLVPGAPDFIKYIVKKHNVYWLTTWCKDGKSDKALEILTKHFPEESIKYLEKIKPTTWRTWKTEAIDFSKDFRWIDDMVFPEEERVLKENDSEDKLVLIDMPHDWTAIRTLIGNLGL
jgi:hypothetical protein